MTSRILAQRELIEVSKVRHWIGSTSLEHFVQGGALIARMSLTCNANYKTQQLELQGDKILGNAQN